MISGKVSWKLYYNLMYVEVFAKITRRGDGWSWRNRYVQERCIAGHRFYLYPPGLYLSLDIMTVYAVFLAGDEKWQMMLTRD